MPESPLHHALSRLCTRLWPPVLLTLRARPRVLPQVLTGLDWIGLDWT